MKCPSCETENLENGKYCHECGESLSYDEHERFRVLVAFLIAFVSIVGAMLAYRVTITAGNAADSDVAGIVSSLNIHQARVASQADLFRDLRAYLQVRIHDQLSHDLIAERDQYSNDDPIRDQLWDQGWTETFIAESYLDKIYIRPEHLRADGSYDEQAALDIRIAHRALEADFDREGHFAEADRLRRKVQLLMLVGFMLAVALFFLTLAQIITHSVKYLFVALGTAISILAVIAMAAIDLTIV
jgi:hypothetical protein